jgi:uncharacterized protein
MVHPDTELRFVNSEIGFGVFATRLIPRGAITWVQDELDRVLTPEKVRQFGPKYAAILSKYCYVNRWGDYVLCWDLARYMNHSCTPSCLSPGYNFELAVRDIAPGEELTDDYATLNLSESFKCSCGASGCRNTVREDDFLTLADRWDDAVREVFPLMTKVPQPLWELVKEKEEVHAALAGGEIASCKLNLREFVQPDLRLKCATPADGRARPAP